MFLGDDFAVKYLSVSETAKRWNLSERSIRNYCAEGRIEGAFLTGKTWNIPEDALKPQRANQKDDMPKDLLSRLRVEKKAAIKGGIYHKVQIELTYNANHMEVSRLTREQTKYILKTKVLTITK